MRLKYKDGHNACGYKMGVEKWANAWKAGMERYVREVKPPVSTSTAEMVLVSTYLDSGQAKSLVAIPSILLHAQSIIRSRIATWGQLGSGPP